MVKKRVSLIGALTAEARERLLEIALGVTVAPPKPRPAPTPKCSDVVRRVSKVVNGQSWGCRKDGIRILAEAIIGEKLLPQPESVEHAGDIKLVDGMCIVPVSNHNSHNYSKRVAMVLPSSPRESGQRGALLAGDDRSGNYIRPDDVRIATADETKAFVAGLTPPVVCGVWMEFEAKGAEAKKEGRIVKV